MKKSLFIVPLFLSALLSSCDEQPMPPEQQESEAAIRDSTLREDVVERSQQKLATKEALEDSLRQENAHLVFYQESLEDSKTNLEAANQERQRLQRLEAGKVHNEDTDQIKYLTLRIATLQADIESYADNIIHTQDAINKLKADLKKL